MLNFLKAHSYDAVKMFVTQCAISIFGLVLSLACLMAENEVLRLVCSVFAILFYLFLIYTSAWELGSKDHIPVQYGHRPYRPHTGLWISLVANSLNFLMAIGFSIGAFFGTVKACATIGTISGTVAMMSQGMYTGILALETGNASFPILNQFWLMYFIIPLPAMLTSWLGYYFGIKNVKFTKFFDAKPNNDKKDQK